MRPSRVAPTRSQYSTAFRVSWKSSRRVCLKRTGRPVRRARMDVKMKNTWSPTLPRPKEPPRYGQITRTLFSGRSSISAMWMRVWSAWYRLVQQVSLPPCQRTRQPRVSRQPWSARWWRDVTSTTTSAAAKPCATSPCS